MAAGGAGGRRPRARAPSTGTTRSPAPGRWSSPRPTGPDDVAYWGYTSGSTGRPKAAVHSHARLRGRRRSRGRRRLRPRRRRSRLLGVEDVLRLRPRQQPLLSRRRVGAAAVLVPERITAERAFETIARRATDGVLHRADAVGAHARGARGRAPLRSLLAPPLRVVGRGAARRAASTPGSRRFGLELRRRGGLDRGAARLHRQPAGRGPRRRLERAGDPRLRDATGGRRGPPGRPRARSGISSSRATSTASGYWNRHERTRSHDARRVAAHRRHVLAGRRRLLLLRGPRRRHAEGRPASGSRRPRSRRSSCAHPAVLEAGVVGRGGRRRPDRAVRLRASSRRERAALAALADASCASSSARALAGVQDAGRIDFVAELPKTATGKIQRFRLRAAATRCESSSTASPRRYGDARGRRRGRR